MEKRHKVHTYVSGEGERERSRDVCGRGNSGRKKRQLSGEIKTFIHN